MGAFKKQDKAPHIEVTWSSCTEAVQDDRHLPKNMVFPSKVVETLSLFCRLSSPPPNDLFTRRVNYDPFASAFLRLAGDSIALAKLAELWDDAAKKLGKKADEAKRQEAFRSASITLACPVVSLSRSLIPEIALSYSVLFPTASGSGRQSDIFLIDSFLFRRECAASLVQMASLAPDVVPMPSDSFDEVSARFVLDLLSTRTVFKVRAMAR